MGTEIIKKNYVVVFKIWAKKKSGPTIPSHPIRQKNRRPESLLKSPLAHTNTGPTVQIRVISLILALVVLWN